MAEYLIQDTTLTNMGDEIRILYGTEETMTPAVMTENLGNANTEINTQTDLIKQILDLLGIKDIITFTFIDTECQAEEGMTWTEWCNSDYNTLNLVINGTAVQNNKHTQAVRKVSDNQTVTANDIIIANETYNFISLA